jgi:hypothetical protein
MATDFVTDPVIVSNNTFRDVACYVHHLYAEDSLKWGSIWPWEFPQNATQDDEENFIREWFSEREIHLHGGAAPPGNGFRFLKQAWYSAALYNLNDRVPLTVQWWFDTNQELWRDPGMTEHFFKPDVEVATFFLQPQVRIFGTKFLKVVVGEIQKRLLTTLSEKRDSPVPLAEKEAASESPVTPLQAQFDAPVKSIHQKLVDQAETKELAEVEARKLEQERLVSPKDLRLTTDDLAVVEKSVSPKTKSYPNLGPGSLPPKPPATTPTKSTIREVPQRVSTIDGSAQAFQPIRPVTGYAPGIHHSGPFEGAGSGFNTNWKRTGFSRQDGHARRNTSWAGPRQDSTSYPASFAIQPLMDGTTSWVPAQSFNHQQLRQRNPALPEWDYSHQSEAATREYRGQTHVMDPGSFQRNLNNHSASSASRSRYDDGNRFRKSSNYPYSDTASWSNHENFRRYSNNPPHGHGGFKGRTQPSPHHFADHKQSYSYDQYSGHRFQTPVEGVNSSIRPKPWVSRHFNDELRSQTPPPTDHQQTLINLLSVHPPGLHTHAASVMPPPHNPFHDQTNQLQPPTNMVHGKGEKYVPPHKIHSASRNKEPPNACGYWCCAMGIDIRCQTATQLVVYHIPSSLSESTLYHMFQKFGSVCDIYRTDHVTFVNYERRESAHSCLTSQMELKSWGMNIVVELSRMHWDPSFVMSPQEANRKIPQSCYGSYDRLAAWLVEHKEHQKLMSDEFQSWLKGSRFHPAQIVDENAPPKKAKKIPNKKKAERREVLTDTSSAAPSSSPEMSRKQDPDPESRGKLGKKKNQQQQQQQQRPPPPRGRAEKAGIHQNKSSMQQELPAPTASEPAQQAKVPSPPIEAETIPDPVVVEDAKETELSQAQPADRVHLEDADHGSVIVLSKGSELPSSNVASEQHPESLDIDESINISEPNTPDAAHHVNLTEAGKLPPRVSSTEAQVTPSLEVVSDPADITASNPPALLEAENDQQDEEKSASVPKTPQPELDQAPVTVKLESISQAADPMQEIAPSSPPVDLDTDNTLGDKKTQSSMAVKKDVAAEASTRVVSGKKQTKPKGAPVTESLSQFGRKNEKKSKPSKGKGTLKGKPKILDAKPATSPEPQAMFTKDKNMKSIDANSSKGTSMSGVSMAEGGPVPETERDTKSHRAETQHDDSAKSSVTKSAGSWLPTLSGLLGKSKPAARIAPAKVDVSEIVSMNDDEVTITAKQPETGDTKQALETESTSGQMPSSPAVRIIVEAHVPPDPRLPDATEGICSSAQSVPDIEKQATKPPHIESTDVVAETDDLPSAEVKTIETKTIDIYQGPATSDARDSTMEIPAEQIEVSHGLEVPNLRRDADEVTESQ